MSPHRRRLVTAGSLCSITSALFIGPQMLGPAADPSLFTVGAGVLLPAGVTGAFWSVSLWLGNFRAVDVRQPHVTTTERERVR